MIQAREQDSEKAGAVKTRLNPSNYCQIRCNYSIPVCPGLLRGGKKMAPWQSSLAFQRFPIEV